MKRSFLLGVIITLSLSIFATSINNSSRKFDGRDIAAQRSGNYQRGQYQRPTTTQRSTGTYRIPPQRTTNGQVRSSSSSTYRSSGSNNSPTRNSSSVSSQSSNNNGVTEVTLTTIGEGSTRDEAVKNAWRSALEQAYGAFMSSSSISVDDELQKDEIVSITSGNIKNYKVLGEVTREDGMIVTSCVVTVSLTKLLDYMQSTGAEVAFSGASFAAKIQLEELNKENERKAIEHLIDALSAMRGLCDYELKLDEPRLNEGMVDIKGRVYLKFNNLGINYGILLYNTLSQLHTPDGKYEVPNLGNFRLRSPLSKSLYNELTNSTIFMRDAQRFVIYDNIHPNIMNSHHSIQFCDDEGNPITKVRDLGDGTVYPFLPYACIPSASKIWHREFRDDYEGYYENPQLKAQKASGKLEVGTPLQRKGRGNTSWWQQLKIPFYYPFRTFSYVHTYAQVGDYFAIIPITITIPQKEIAKYTTFGVKYSNIREIEQQKAEQERIKAEQEKQRKEQERIKAQQEQAAKEKAYVDSLKNTYAKIQRGGQDVKKGINSPEAQYVYKQIVLLKDTSKHMGLIADTIAMCYNKGYGVERNQDVAADWLWKAAQHGNLDAMETVGYAYLYQLTWYSNYCSVNPKKAYHWLGKAIKLNPNDENLKKAYSKAQKIVSVMNKYGNAKMSWKIEILGAYTSNDRYLILDVYEKEKNGDIEFEYSFTVLEEKLYYSGDSGTWLY